MNVVNYFAFNNFHFRRKTRLKFKLTDSNEQKLSLEVLGDLGSGGMVSGIFIRAFAQEHQQVALDFTREDFLSSFVIEVNHKRKSIGSHEFTDSFSISQAFGQVISAFIELFEEDNGFSINFVFGSDIGSGGGNTEFVVIVGAGDFFEGFGGVGFQVSEKTDNGNIVVFDESLGGVDRV